MIIPGAVPVRSLKGKVLGQPFTYNVASQAACAPGADRTLLSSSL